MFVCRNIYLTFLGVQFNLRLTAWAQNNESESGLKHFIFARKHIICFIKVTDMKNIKNQQNNKI